MTTIVNRAIVKEMLESTGEWLTAQEIAQRLGYTGVMKNVSNALSGLFTDKQVDKRKAGTGRGVEYRMKTTRGPYKPREKKQEDLPLGASTEVTKDSNPTTPSLMNPEFEILSVSLGKIMADNNNMRAALTKCRDAINQALEG